MATVPGILYIGDYHCQGGNPGLQAAVDGIDVSPLVPFGDRKVMRVTPDDETTGAPTASSLSFWPWYDGAASTTDYTVDSSSTTTAVVSPSPGWTVNEHAGKRVSFRNTTPIAGVGFQARPLVVSNTADTITFAALSAAPNVGAVFFFGEGMFLDYHPAAGYLHPTEILSPNSLRGGSSYQAGGNGVGPDATMIRALFERLFPDAPYFHLFKYANTTPVCDGWADSPNDSARATFLAEMVKVEAAAAARGNTIDWQYIIIDLSSLDVEAAGGDVSYAINYSDRLIEMVNWLRSAAVTNNATCKLVLVNHDPQLWNTTTPLGTAFFRAIHKEAVRYDGSNTTLVDMRGQPLGDGDDLPGAEVKYYSQRGYFNYGEMVVDAMVRLSLGEAPEQQGGYPVYLMLGDSITAGEIELEWTTKCNSVELAGPNPPSLLRPSNQQVYNRTSLVLETYEPHLNSNTSGSVTGLAGPEMSILAELGKKHPDGFALIKRGGSGSGLASAVGAYNGNEGGRWVKAAGEHYPELQTDFATAVAYINNTLGKQADVRAAFVSLGHNDQAVTGGGEAFDDAIAGFCADLWEDFGTRTSGRKFPILWRRPQDDASGVTAAEMAEVREALEKQGRRESQFRKIDVDDLERDRVDDVHETPESAIEHGRRAVALLTRVGI